MERIMHDIKEDKMLKWIVDLPLTIARQLVLNLNIEQVKFILLYTYTMNKYRFEKYRRSAGKIKALLF